MNTWATLSEFTFLTFFLCIIIATLLAVPSEIIFIRPLLRAFVFHTFSAFWL